QRNRGLQTIMFYSVAQHPSETALMLGGTQDNGGLRYLGHPLWQHVQDGDAFYAVIPIGSPTEWYLSMLFEQGTVIRSRSFGANGTFGGASDGIERGALDYFTF